MPATTAPKLKRIARRLIDCEAAAGQRADVQETVAFRVCGRMRGPLGKLMGIGGFRSLLSRALALAGAEIPWLRTLRINPDGSFGSLEEPELKLDPGATAEGEIVLVSQLLGLLVTFIGAGLTERLLHDIWPDLDGLNF